MERHGNRGQVLWGFRSGLLDCDDVFLACLGQVSTISRFVLGYLGVLFGFWHQAPPGSGKGGRRYSAGLWDTRQRNALKWFTAAFELCVVEGDAGTLAGKAVTLFFTFSV